LGVRRELHGGSQVARIRGRSGGQRDVARDRQRHLSEAGGAAVAAILHLLRLVSAELVLLRGLDIANFEAAARKKIDEFTSPTTNAHARDAGLAFAHQMLEQILVQIRAQAELKKRLGPSDEKPAAASPSLAPQSKLLN
jgi:hypothetical protein